MVRGILACAGVLALPRLALACPVCFGQNDSALAVAMNSGILLMLGVVVAVLGGFAAFMVYIARRARVFADMPDGAADSYSESNPQEGTARC
jgi:hypothetical protein